MFLELVKIIVSLFLGISFLTGVAGGLSKEPNMCNYDQIIELNPAYFLGCEIPQILFKEREFWWVKK